MNKLFLFALSFLFVSIAFSQDQGFTSHYAYGEPFENRAYREKAGNSVDGTPMLFDDWRAGEVLLKNGEKYIVGRMNLDAVVDKFLFLEHDTLFEFADNVKEIKIYSTGHSDNPRPDIVFRTDINSLSSNFMQVLTYGKVTLFRHYDKKAEGENYSNGIVNNSRKYVLHNIDFVLLNNTVSPISKYTSSLLDELTADKKEQVETYIKVNNLKPKKEIDFVKAITFYNSIK
ncbi:MAG: hypothetical protein ABI834_04930 [Ginsengibacter sp.]